MKRIISFFSLLLLVAVAVGFAQTGDTTPPVELPVDWTTLVLGVLLAISELLGSIDRFKSSSIFQLIWMLLKKLKKGD